MAIGSRSPAGILVYWQVNYGSARTRPWAWLLLASGVAYAVLILPSRGVLDRDLVAAMGFAFFLLAIHRWDAPVAVSPTMRPLAFAGTICYSLYLSHAVVVRTISQLMWDAGVTSPLGTLAISIPICVAAAVLVGLALPSRRRAPLPQSAFRGPVGAERHCGDAGRARHVAGGLTRSSYAEASVSSAIPTSA